MASTSSSAVDSLATKLMFAAKPPPGRAKEILQSNQAQQHSSSSSGAGVGKKATKNGSIAPFDTVPAAAAAAASRTTPTATDSTDEASKTQTDKRTNGSLKVPDFNKHAHARTEQSVDDTTVAMTSTAGGDSRSGTALSRRDSADSRFSGASTVDFSKLLPMQSMGANDRGNDDDQDNSITSSDSYIRSAIPCMPLWLAVICLALNTALPGLGTIISGFTVFCCGEPRVRTKDDNKTTAFCVNIWVGISQLFTVPFMLVGWFWSFVWGIYMVIIAAERRREKKEQREKELQAKALTAFSTQFKPWAMKA